MTVGELIKNERKKAGMTQAELGKKLGISGAGIAQWENNLRKPKKETLWRIASALNTNYLNLFPEDERAGVIIEHIRAKFRNNNPIAKELPDDELIDALSEIPEEYRGDAVRAVAIDRLTKAGLTVTDGGKVLIQGDGKPWLKVPITPKDRVEAAFERLSPEGQQAAAERLEELALLEKYQKKEPSDGS